MNFASFVNSLGRHDVNRLLLHFTDGVQSGLGVSGQNNFSSFVSAVFFEPGSEDNHQLFRVMTHFEKTIMSGEVLSVFDILPGDRLGLERPGRNVAEQFVRASRTSAFTELLKTQITSSEWLNALLRRSRRPNASRDFFELLCAFASLHLLTSALSMTRETVVAPAYLHRVLEAFSSDHASVSTRLYFCGPMKPLGVFAADDAELFVPMPAVSERAFPLLSKIVVAAHRVLCRTSSVSPDEIVSWTNLVITSFYVPAWKVWEQTLLVVAVPARAPVCADLALPITPRVGAPRVRAGKEVVKEVVKSTLRIASPMDNF
jgi:hypothetical protein